MRLYDLTINEYVDKFGKMTEKYFIQYMTNKGHNVDWVEKMRWTNYNAMFNKLVDAGKIKGQEANSRYWIRAFRDDVANIGKFISMVQNDGKLNESTNLNEKLLEIDDDVERIYDKYFKDVIEKIQNKEYTDKKQFIKDLKNYRTKVALSTLISDGIVQSPELIDVNERHKGVLFSFNERDGGFYNPSMRIVTISIDTKFVKLLINNDYDIDTMIELMGDDKPTQHLKNMVTPKHVKGTIHHELSHLYDNVMHNRHIEKWLSKRATNNNFVDKHMNPVEVTPFEIDGIIHTIQQFKKSIDDWDSLTFERMVNEIPSLAGIKSKYFLGRPAIWNKWKKLVLKRMAREGLLGNNMR